MLQIDVYPQRESSDVLAVQAQQAAIFGRWGVSRAVQGWSYPQVVDNIVDNHVNCPQNRTLRP
jgi:hypothetical protein